MSFMITFCFASTTADGIGDGQNQWLDGQIQPSQRVHRVDAGPLNRSEFYGWWQGAHVIEVIHWTESDAHAGPDIRHLVSVAAAALVLGSGLSLPAEPERIPR
jgi:hypothetical protein